MKTKTNWKSGNLNFFDGSLNSSFKNGVWADCPLQAIRTDPKIGYTFFEDFVDYSGAAITGTTLTGWVVTAATTGTVANAAVAGGIVTCDAGAVTAGQGVNLSKIGSNFVLAANKDLWFECQFATTYPTKLQSFFGLATAGTALNAAGDLATATLSYIGFGTETGASGVCSFYSNTAGGTEVKAATGPTIASATVTRLGFKVTSNTGITAYADGVALSTAISVTGIPVAAMTPYVVVQADGTSRPVLSLDWIRCVQLR